MTLLRKVVREIRRRTLWQVLAVFVVGAWAVLRGVEYLTRLAGLPEWTSGLALVLLLAGFPIVAITAFVQRGATASAASPGPVDPSGPDADDHEDRPSPGHPRRHQGLFTWRNTMLGALGAGTLLLTSVSAYLVMWATGVGPMGSLVAQGVLDEGDPVIIAELEDRAGDPALAAAVTDVLGVDLLESAVISPVDVGAVAEMLRRMGRSGSQPVTSTLAREAAVREGIKAVVEGEVSRMGEGYAIVARLVAPADGRSIAAFQETARTPGALMGAVDRLSLRLREKAGESLRDIRAEEPLEAVTTSSLDALRRFAEADRATEEGDLTRAADLLAEAVTLDTTFAMAYRRLAIVHSRPGGDAEAVFDAVSRAYGNRDRLTERERHLTEALYHRVVTGDDDEVARAYRRVLDTHPHDGVALCQLALVHLGRSEWPEARELLERAVNAPGRNRSSFADLVISLYREGRGAEAVEVLDRWATGDLAEAARQAPQDES